MPVTKLTEKLHLVVPIYPTSDSDSPNVWVHSAPISRHVFESNYLLISKTFSAIYAEGLSAISGPRVASLILQDVARKANRDPSGGLSLMNEIRRLTNVLVKTVAGWEHLPWDMAVKDHISEDDASEVENAIVFFIVASRMLTDRMRKEMISEAATLWGAQITSSDFTAFTASQQTLTPVVPTGVNPIQGSSVPF